MKFINFAIVQLAIAMSLGIGFARLFPIEPKVLITVAFASLISLVICWRRSRKILVQDPVFGYIALFLFFVIGFGNYSVRTPQYNQSHYSRSTKESGEALMALRITEVLKSTTFSDKYFGKLIPTDKSSLSGKLLVTIKKDSSCIPLTIDDVILTSGIISPISPSLNPGQFDYAAYLKKLDVFGRVSLSGSEFSYLAKKASFRGWAWSVRESLVAKLDNGPLPVEERSLIKAMVLGDRREVDPKLFKAYSSAGVVHILAVSGLHVGIVFLILSGILSPLRWSRIGRKICPVIIIIVLFCYAIITGASPPVLRAVTMFSLLAFASLLNRPTNNINTLFLSYFLLLLMDPNWLFQVSFQFSYLAVFFILWLQPKLYSIFIPTHFILRKLWGIITVSVAAQLGLLPLSLYYFNQFPGLFLLSNLVIVPFLFVIISGGILIIALTLINYLPEFLVSIYVWLLQNLNSFVRWVATKDRFLIKEVYFNEWMLIGWYLLIIATIAYWKRPRNTRFKIALISLFAVFIISFWSRYSESGSEVVLFHKYGNTMLGSKEGDSLVLYKFNSSDSAWSGSFVTDYRTFRRIRTYSESELPLIFDVNRKVVLMVDSSGIYSSQLNPDIVVLTDNPRIHLDKLIEELKPAQIVADGSNYNAYIRRWRESCKRKKLPFHFTGEKGAFVFE